MIEIKTYQYHKGNEQELNQRNSTKKGHCLQGTSKSINCFQMKKANQEAKPGRTVKKSRKSISKFKKPKSESRQCKQRIKDANDAWRGTLDAISDAICELDSNKRIVQFNKPLQKLLKKSKRTIIGKTCCQLIHGSSRPLKNCPWKKMLGSRKREMEDIQKDNHWMRATVDPIFDGQGKIMGAVLIITDISNYKAVEEALRKSEERYRTLFESSPEGMLSSAPDGTVVSANPASAEILGYDKPDDLIGMRIVELYPDPIIRKELLAELGEKGYLRNREVNIRRKDGTTIKLLANLKVIEDSNRNTLRIDGIFSDITEQKLALKALRQSRERLNAFMQSAMDGFLLFDSRLNLIELNNAALQMFPPGTKREHILGKHLLDISPGLEKTGRYDKYMRVAKSGEPFFAEDISPHKKFGEKHLSLKAFQVDQGVGIVFADVTDAKRSKAELLQAKTFLDCTLSSAPDGVFLIDTQGIFTYANPAFLRMIAYKENAIVGKSIREIVPKIVPLESSEIIQERAKRRLQTGEPIVGAEVELISKDKKTIPVLYSASGIKDTDGNVLGEAVFIRDITDLRKTIDKLEASEQRRGFYLESTWQLDWTTNEQGEVTNDVPAWRSYTGQSIQEAKGWGWLGAIHPEDIERTTEKWQEVVRSKANYEAEFRVRDKDGHYRWFLSKAVPLLNRDGGIQEWIGTCIDIHEMKQAEKLLQERESLFRGVFESKMTGILFWNAKGDIIDANDTFLEMVGYTKEEVLSGKVRWRDMTPPEYTELDDNGLKEIATSGAMTPIEKEYIRKDGTRIPILLGAASLPGTQHDGVAFVLDISEKKQAEHDLEEYREHLEEMVKERTAELEAFSYSVSHDLRAPLRAIDGFSKILFEDHSPNLNAEGNRILNVIQNNTAKMGQLIDDLLKFSRIGRQEITLSGINMKKLARSVFDELSSLESKRLLTFKMDEMPNSNADRNLIQEVFANLLSNALKFTRPRKEAMIHVGAEASEDECIYYVKDNGVGFNMKYKSKLFQVFQRLHSVSDFEGTGVGLALVKRIIDKHGGRVWAEGELNKGATFYFTLPRIGQPVNGA
jgi:PAS domain S-box-containing protein